MRVLAGVLLALAAAAPAAAEPLVFTGVPRGQAPWNIAGTTLTRVDAGTLQPFPGSLAVDGSVLVAEGAPDGRRFAVLGRTATDGVPAGIITFADTPTMARLGDPVTLEGTPLTALWTRGDRLLVVTNAPARVLTIDPTTQTVVGAVDLAGAPADAAVVGDRYVVLDTGDRALRVFGADGTLERTVALDRLGAGRHIALAAQGGRLIAFASASGRFATVDPATGTATVRRTGLRSPNREPIIAVTAHRFAVERRTFDRAAVAAVDRATGRSHRIGTVRNGRFAGAGWLSSSSGDVLNQPVAGVPRYDVRGRRTWTALPGLHTSFVTLGPGHGYAVADEDGRLHAFSLADGHETGSTSSTQHALVTEPHGSFGSVYGLSGSAAARSVRRLTPSF